MLLSVLNVWCVNSVFMLYILPLLETKLQYMFDLLCAEYDATMFEENEDQTCYSFSAMIL